MILPDKDSHAFEMLIVARTLGKLETHMSELQPSWYSYQTEETEKTQKKLADLGPLSSKLQEAGLFL